MTQKLFANFTSISEGSLSGVFNGRTKPTLQMVDAIHQRLPQISLDWLLYGTGTMYKDEKATTSAAGSSADTNTDHASESTAASPAPSLFENPQNAAHANAPENIRNQQPSVIKYIDKPQRKITEIRVFFDDKTWETFLPAK